MEKGWDASPGTHSGSPAPSPGHIQAGSLGSGHRNWPRASSPGKRCNLGVGLFPCEGSYSPLGSCSLLLSNLQAAICWQRTLATPSVRLIPGKQPVFWGASLPAGLWALPLSYSLRLPSLSLGTRSGALLAGVTGHESGPCRRRRGIWAEAKQEG